MIKTVQLFSDNESVAKELEDLISQGIAVKDEDNVLFFKEGNEKQVESFLNKYPDYHESVNDIYDYIRYYDGGGYIKLGAQEFSKSLCVNKLIEKIEQDENIILNIFNLKAEEINIYIDKLVNMQLLDAIDDFINELQVQKDKIKDGNFEWR